MSKQKITSSDILQAVDVVVNKRIDDLQLDKTIVATIDKALTPDVDGSHRVQYAGGYFTAYAPIKTIYAPNTTVYVQVPQNNFSNKKIILGTASAYYSEADIETVSTSINNYVPIGKNILTLNNETYKEVGYGLNSYAPYVKDSQGNVLYQETILLYDKSNSDKNSQYSLNQAELNTYLKEAKAIMIQGDFRTILRDEQKECAGAEYGLIFDMVFKNQDGVYKTQGELFNAVSNNIHATRTDSEGIDHDVTMTLYDLDVRSALNSSETIADIQIELVKISNYIKSFIDTNADRFTAQEASIFEAYKYMVLQLSVDLAGSAEKLKTDIYDAWFSTELGLTEEQKSQTKTLTYALTSSRMTGNPFSFTAYNTQYMIFPIDVENFSYIERIYFYEKGFIEDTNKYKWVDENRTKMPIKNGELIEYHGKDIWMKNMKLFALKEITSEYGDYKFRIETPNGCIFKPGEIDTLTVNADVRYKEYNTINDDCAFYWFIKDNRITSASNSYYDWHGGIGWRYLGTSQLGHISTFTAKAEDNKAYENKYMCAAVYKGAADGTITLKQYFTLYNEAWKRLIDISSSLGVKFKFDAGTPTLTCTIDEKEELFESEETAKRLDEAFKFVWSRRSSTGQVFLFNRTYDEVREEWNNTLDYNSRLSLETQMNNLRDVEYPKGIYGNKLTYPVRYLGSDSSATFECQVYTTDHVDWTTGKLLPTADFATNFFSIGTAELTLSNEGMANINEYTIVIEGGDQVFQYSESGVSPTFASGVTPTDFRHTDPLEIKELHAHFYTPNGIEVSEGTYSVKWQFPIEDTLVIPGDGVVLYDNPADGKIDLTSGQTTTLKIADSYDYNALNNQIQCIITYGGQTYTQYTNFFFGKIGDNGTNGTDVVAKIIVENDVGHVMDKYPLTAYIYNNDVTWNIGGRTNPILQLKLYNRSTLIESGQYSNIEWDVLGGIKRSEYIKLTPDSYDPAKATLKLDLTNSEKNDKRYHNQIIKVSAKLKSTGQTYYCYFPLIIATYTGTPETFIENFGSGRISIDNTSYLKQILYNADGRNPLYNKNQGITFTNLSQRKIIWKVRGNLNTDTNVPIGLIKNKDDIESVSLIEDYGRNTIYIHPSDVYDGVSCDNRVEVTIYVSENDQVRLETYNRQKNALDAAYKEDCAAIKEQIRQESISYERKITKEERQYNLIQTSIQESDLTDENKQLQLVSAKNNHETFLDNLKTDHDIEIKRLNDVVLKNREDKYNTDLNNLNELIYVAENRKIVFSIPIYLAFNTFGLASLNAWDGNHVDINEDDGYIVAPQIGAGKKESNNSFTGIVMGEMSEYSSEESDIGLLGLLGGRQTIFLDSQTGNAYFGLQEGVKAIRDSDGNFERYELTTVNNYNEGRIELIPGGESKIGGWRLGRQALYYTSNKDLDLLKQNHLMDYIPKVGSDTLQPGDTYYKNHIRDIGLNQYGIMLYPGEYPYLSIKGRKIVKGDNILDDSESKVAIGDALEIQIDSSTPTLFTIFRHNGNAHGRDEQGNLREGKRTFLAGINAKGELVANAIQNSATNPGGRETPVSSNIEWMRAFEDEDGQKTYIGAKYLAGDIQFARFIVKGGDLGSFPTLHITGGKTGGSGASASDYPRAIHIHGNNVALYASSGTNSLTTNSKVTISESLAYIGNTGAYLQLAPYGNSNTILHSARPVEFTFGNQSFDITSGAYTFKPSTITETATGAIERKTTGGNITEQASSNIYLKSSGGSGYKVELTSNTALLGIENNANSYIKLQQSSTGNSVFQSKGSIRIEAKPEGSSGGQLYLYGNSNGENYFKTWNTAGENPTEIKIKSLSGVAASEYGSNAKYRQIGSSGVKNFHEIVLNPTSSAYLQTGFFLKPGSATNTSNETAVTAVGWQMGGGLKTGWLYATDSEAYAIQTEGGMYAKQDVTAGTVTLKTHKHDFSKGVTVYVCQGSTNENPGVGSNATLRVDPTASISSKSVNTDSIKTEIEIYGFSETQKTLYEKTGTDSEGKPTYDTVDDVYYVRWDETVVHTITGKNDYSYGSGVYMRVKDIDVPNDAINAEATVDPMEQGFTVHGTTSAPNA